MSHLVDGIAELLLHPRLRGDDPEPAFVGRVTLSLVLGGLAGALFVNVYFAVAGDLRLAWAHLGFLGAVLVAPLFTRHIGTARAIQGYTLGLSWAMITLVVALTGGATPSALYFFALLPFLGAGLGGRALGTVWAGLALASAAVFYALYLGGVRLPTEGVYAHMIDTPSVAAATPLVFFISVVFVRSRRDARASVAAADRAVSEANARAEAARAEVERAHAAKLVALTRVGDGLDGPLTLISDAARRLSAALPAEL